MMTANGKDFMQAQLFGTAPASNGANYIALTANSTAPASSDATLAGEYAAAGGGLNRAQGTVAHTAGTSTTTITKTSTANANDGTSNPVNKAGLLTAATGGTLVLTTLVPTPPTLLVADSVATTWNQTY